MYDYVSPSLVFLTQGVAFSPFYIEDDWLTIDSCDLEEYLKCGRKWPEILYIKGNEFDQRPFLNTVYLKCARPFQPVLVRVNYDNFPVLNYRFDITCIIHNCKFMMMFDEDLFYPHDPMNYNVSMDLFYPKWNFAIESALFYDFVYISIFKKQKHSLKHGLHFFADEGFHPFGMNVCGVIDKSRQVKTRFGESNVLFREFAQNNCPLYRCVEHDMTAFSNTICENCVEREPFEQTCVSSKCVMFNVRAVSLCSQCRVFKKAEDCTNYFYDRQIGTVFKGKHGSVYTSYVSGGKSTAICKSHYCKLSAFYHLPDDCTDYAAVKKSVKAYNGDPRLLERRNRYKKNHV